MRDIDIEDTRQPDDEPGIFIECAICEAVENVEDANQVYHALHVCLSCRNEIHGAYRLVIVPCIFCTDATDYAVTLNNGSVVFMCNDCFVKASK